MYSFVKLLSCCYLASFSFYHFSFVTLSTYFHIFIAFNILTCDFTSYRQSFNHFFFSNLKMISARSKRRKILSLVLS